MKRNRAFTALIAFLIFTQALPRASAQMPLSVTLPLAGLSNVLLLAPKDLAKFMKENFRFVEDARLFRQEDYWQSPEEFWKRRAGDCEDYALFSQYVLSLQGKESFVVSFYDATGYGHTVTLVLDEGRYDVMNEDRFYRYRAGTIEEALTRIHPVWTWAAVAVRKNTRGEMVRRMINPDLKAS